MKSEIVEILEQAQATATELLAIAERGDSIQADDGFRVLVGVVRDAAYRIRREIERELRAQSISTRTPSGWRPIPFGRRQSNIGARQRRQGLNKEGVS